MQSDRLLNGMHKVFSHDLPNQLVALQSLLQMLQMEESERLSSDGKEYVQRLQNVTRRTSGMVRFLKEMGRLHTYVGKPESLKLSMLAREIQGNLKQQFPRHEFHFDWHWDAPALVADYRTFLQAISEIFACLIHEPASVCRVQGRSALSENQVTLHFLLASNPSTDDNDPHLAARPAGATTLEQRMEILLAREWLAVSGAALTLADHKPDGDRFILTAPHR